jgi:hypothetical protein
VQQRGIIHYSQGKIHGPKGAAAPEPPLNTSTGERYKKFSRLNEICRDYASGKGRSDAVCRTGASPVLADVRGVACIQGPGQGDGYPSLREFLKIIDFLKRQ